MRLDVNCVGNEISIINNVHFIFLSLLMWDPGRYASSAVFGACVKLKMRIVGFVLLASQNIHIKRLTRL